MNATMYSKLITKYQNKYSKNNINNTNKKSTNKYKIKIIRRFIPDDADLSSILGKRNYDNAFSQETYDDLRYGQHININFFENNIGCGIRI
jgi:hypothetical protein